MVSQILCAVWLHLSPLFPVLLNLLWQYEYFPFLPQKGNIYNQYQAVLWLYCASMETMYDQLDNLLFREYSYNFFSDSLTTSSCLATPPAIFAIKDTPKTLILSALAIITSGIVDIHTASAPNLLNISISACVS